MRRLDRFIIAELVPPFFFGVMAFTSLILGVGAIYRIIRLSLDYHMGMGIVVALVGLKLPEVIAYTMPMATLFCILLAFNRLSNDLEVTAFRAAGVSFLRLVVPVLFFALGVSLAGVMINDQVVPFFNGKYNRILDAAKARAQHVQDESHVLVRTQQGETERVLYAGRLAGGSLDEVTFAEYEGGALKSITTARRAVWRGRRWQFMEGARTDFGSDGTPRDIVKFRRLNIIFNQTLWDIKRRNENLDIGDLTIRQTRDWIALLEKSGTKDTDVRKLKVDYHGKLAIPFASFIFARSIILSRVARYS